MRTRQNILFTVLALMVVVLMLSCVRHRKHLTNAPRQQQDFPERIVNQDNEPCVEVQEIDTLAEEQEIAYVSNDNEVVEDDESDAPQEPVVTTRHSHRRDNTAQSSTPNPAPKKEVVPASPSPSTPGIGDDNNSMAYNDNYGYNDDYSSGSYYDDQPHYDVPSSVSSMRPVQPRGKFRKFNPQNNRW